MSSISEVVLPEIDTVNSEFFSKLKENKLLIQYCEKCGNLQLYPRPICVRCGNVNLKWKESKGTGKIYTFTVIYRVINNSKVFEKDVPYIVGIIELDEGVRVYGRIKSQEPTNIKIGSSVKLEAKVTDNIGLPAFTLLM